LFLKGWRRIAVSLHGGKKRLEWFKAAEGSVNEKGNFQVKARKIALFRHTQHGKTAKIANGPRSPRFNRI
jgi:hypothetical protein